MAFPTAVNNQITDSVTQTNVTAQAATTMGVTTLYSLDTASVGKSTAAILQSKVAGL